MPGFAEVEANLKRVAAVGITATEAIEAMRRMTAGIAPNGPVPSDAALFSWPG